MWRLGAEEYPVIRLGGRNTVEQGQHEADAANGARARDSIAPIAVPSKHYSFDPVIMQELFAWQQFR
jgi:hypothetical protein